MMSMNSIIMPTVLFFLAFIVRKHFKYSHHVFLNSKIMSVIYLIKKISANVIYWQVMYHTIET